VLVLAVLLPCTTWCIPHLGVSCTDRNSNRTGAISHNSILDNFSNNSHNSSSSNSSTVLLPHRHSRLQSGHHSRLPTVAFQATIAESWDISPVSASCQRKAIHLDLRQLWSIIRRAHRGVLHHRLVVPTIPLWRKFSWEKKC
jgi:hypothetical protein